MKVVGNKHRVYTGQIVCSENYNNFDQEQRNFWNKCYKAFRKGQLHFDYQGKPYIVPFKIADGSFDTVFTAQELDKVISAQKEKSQNEQTIRTADSGQGEPVDLLASSVE